MATWKKLKTHCPNCGRWNYDLPHMSCSLGREGSTVWLDIDKMEVECNKCNLRWSLTNADFTCLSCGYQWKSRYISHQEFYGVGFE